MTVGLIGSFPGSYVRRRNGKLGRLAENRSMDEQGKAAFTVPAPRRANGAEESRKSGHESPKPDTPFRFVGRLVIALAHAVVLFGIVCLLLWQVVPLITGPKVGCAQIVAAPLHEIRAAYDGVFVAIRHMPNGTRVVEGQLLGEIRSPRLDADIKTVQGKLDALRRRKLLLEQPGPEFRHSLYTPDREFRECAAEIDAMQSELDRLQQIRRGLRVVSPVSGQISNGGFSGSKAVETNDTVAYVWPDNGDLLVEVKAPLKAVHRLIQADRVEAEFSTVGGEAAVTARPIAGALRVFTLDRGAGRKKELWGILQCRPTSMPESVAYPGPIGKVL
ncbi:MAG: efflux RND transporter periplasmic adaptor subunit [Planctomycetota bacterium]|jgi:hypothetical protein